MTVLKGVHDDHGATWTEYGGRRVVADYGRPARAHAAVRNGVGVIELGYGVVEVTGDDRIEFVDNVVSNHVPRDGGRGCYAVLCDAQGGVTTDLYAYNASERLLVFVPPDRADPLVADWADKVFIQDVDITERTEDLTVFGVYGPSSTEKVASVLNKAGAPEEPLTFVRGSMDDAGVTVVASDAPPGEEGYEVVCATTDAEDVADTLLTRGMNAAPFGYTTWNSLTLEAGTPLFHTELEGRIPNVAGIRNALDFEKGCFVGQEVVSRVENRGRPSRRLIGLTVHGDEVPEPGASVFDGDSTVGEITRAAQSPTRDEVVALAYADYGQDKIHLTVRVDGDEVSARMQSLPFVDGSQQSARLPKYPK